MGEGAWAWGEWAAPPSAEKGGPDGSSSTATDPRFSCGLFRREEIPIDNTGAIPVIIQEGARFLDGGVDGTFLEDDCPLRNEVHPSVNA
ncbi:hypothetical protein CDAR_523451 [Caerostris darwini]|uniref:Uncharacterized protein n=1 Tax=Caerostris darwini TaxID=1538125 RepID=A0AAV4QLY3_9ARAC|nr:hypothetical protein CDAR_523451 [Caerostris darwini]